MRKSKMQLVVSFFGLMLGGLLLVHGFKAVLIGLLKEEAVLDRVLNGTDLLCILAACLIGTGIWYAVTFRDKP